MGIPQIELNKTSRIDEVLSAAETVFKPTPEELKKYHNKKEWLQKVETGGLLVDAYMDNKVVGFCICEKRDNVLHLWNGGVLSEYRKQGIWTQMHNKVLEHAKEKGFKKVTLNTYKEKFPQMYNFALAQGYTEVSKKYDDFQKLTKSHFERLL